MKVLKNKYKVGQKVRFKDMLGEERLERIYGIIGQNGTLFYMFYNKYGGETIPENEIQEDTVDYLRKKNWDGLAEIIDKKEK